MFKEANLGALGPELILSLVEIATFNNLFFSKRTTLTA